MDIADEALSWYCVRSKVKRERIAARALADSVGVEVFCPHVRIRRKTKRGVCRFEEAMFPGYFFARFDLSRELRAVSYSHGVTGLVHFGDRYAQVPEAVVAALKASVGENEVAAIEDDLYEGDRVLIAEGPFSGLPAVVIGSSSGSERVRVLLDFLGRQVDALLSAENLVRSDD